MFIAPHIRTIHFLLPLSSPGDDFTFTISRSSDVYELSIANKRSRNDRHRSPSRVTKNREGGRKHKSTQAFLFPFVYLLDGSATAVRCANIAAKVSYSINHAPSTILLPILCTGMYICIYIYTHIYTYVIRPWHGAKYINIYRFVSKRKKESLTLPLHFDCHIGFQWFPFSFSSFFIFVEEDAIGKLETRAIARIQ